jgi:anti-sigma B factor antagonist
MTFEYQTSKKDKINIIQLSGELIDRNQATTMLTEIEESINGGENKFLLNLQDLKYVNSSGLNVLINVLTKARKAGGDLAVCNVNSKIAQLMTITKLDTIFNVSTDEASAFNKLISAN